MEFNFAYILSLVLRSLVLGGIVFLTTTNIPEKTPSFASRLMISVLVVVMYALIDYVNTFLIGARNLMCSVACGCNPGDPTPTDLDLDTLTK